MRTLAIVSGKGGSAKTTTAVNLGAELVARGRSVLLVDLDPQGSLGTALGLDLVEDVATMAEVLAGGRGLDQLARVAGLDVATAGRGLAAVETQLGADPTGVYALVEVLRTVSRRFDVAILDTAPHLGTLTVAALVAAGEVLIPVTAEFLGLRQLGPTLDAVAKVRARANKRLRVLGLLPTMVSRTRHADEVLAELPRAVEAFAGARVFAPVPRRVAVAESAVAGRPLLETDPHSEAREAYRLLAKEVDA